MAEVGPAGLGYLGLRDGDREQGRNTACFVRLCRLRPLAPAERLLVLCDHLGRVPGCDYEGVPRRLGHGKPEVEGDAAGHGAHADHDAPHLVHGRVASVRLGAVGGLFRSDERVLETDSNHQEQQSRRKLTNSLHGEDRIHHEPCLWVSTELVSRRHGSGKHLILTSPFCCSELRGDCRR